MRAFHCAGSRCYGRQHRLRGTLFVLLLPFGLRLRAVLPAPPTYHITTYRTCLSRAASRTTNKHFTSVIPFSCLSLAARCFHHLPRTAARCPFHTVDISHPFASTARSLASPPAWRSHCSAYTLNAAFHVLLPRSTPLLCGCRGRSCWFRFRFHRIARHNAPSAGCVARAWFHFLLSP